MRMQSIKLYSRFTLILERLSNPEKELRGSATTAEDKGDRPWLAHTQTPPHTLSSGDYTEPKQHRYDMRVVQKRKKQEEVKTAR